MTCACGCETEIDPLDARGRPRRFVSGHNARGATRRVYQATPTNYPRVGAIRVHRLRAERALGRPLPASVPVHHVDHSKREDAPLVICQDAAYHNLLHARARVVRAGGNPNTETICKTCKQLTPSIGANGGRVDRCPPCNRRLAHQRRTNGAPASHSIPTVLPGGLAPNRERPPEACEVPAREGSA